VSLVSEGAGTLDDGQRIIWRLAFDQVYDSPVAIPQSRRQNTRDRLTAQSERQGKGLCQRWVVWAQGKVDGGTRGLSAFLNVFKRVDCGENSRTPHGIARVWP
jgi:hypothetical protein